jgi:hypothetical protein
MEPPSCKTYLWSLVMSIMESSCTVSTPVGAERLRPNMGGVPWKTSVSERIITLGTATKKSQKITFIIQGFTTVFGDKFISQDLYHNCKIFSATLENLYDLLVNAVLMRSRLVRSSIGCSETGYLTQVIVIPSYTSVASTWCEFLSRV